MASLSTTEYADLHGVSTSTVRRWISDFLIYAEKIGGRFYIPEEELPPAYTDFSEERSKEGTTSNVRADLQEEANEEPIFPEREKEDTEEETEDEKEDEEPDDCKDPSEFDKKDRRKFFATLEEAQDYAADIPVPTEIFRRCEDGFFQVAVTY